MKPKKLSLCEKTRQMLAERPRTLTLEELAARLDVSVNWLSMFSRGAILNPGVNTIQRLYDLLAERPLEY